jgi:hypothetical protein
MGALRLPAWPHLFVALPMLLFVIDASRCFRQRRRSSSGFLPSKDKSLPDGDAW